MRPILVILALLIAGPAFAQDVTYRPTAGEFTVRVDTGPQGNEAATKSVAVERVDNGSQLACAAASNDEVVDVVVSVPAQDLPLVVVGRAFSQDACSGPNTPSSNTATLELGPPAAPELLP